MNHTEFSRRGGKARAKAMTAKERKRIATLAAKSRWKTKRVTAKPNDEAQRGRDAAREIT